MESLPPRLAGEALPVHSGLYLPRVHLLPLAPVPQTAQGMEFSASGTICPLCLCSPHSHAWLCLFPEAASLANRGRLCTWKSPVSSLRPSSRVGLGHPGAQNTLSP